MNDPNRIYHPLLPKTNQDFRGGDAPGKWIFGQTALFNELGNSLEFDAVIDGEINSIPSPWSRALQLLSAMRNPNYPYRKRLIAQYRGLLATLALAENLKLHIQATSINLNDTQIKNTDFGHCLAKLRPNPNDNIFSDTSSNVNWSSLFLFELEGNVIGFTSPATLVVPVGYLNSELQRRVSWIIDGFFSDPIERLSEHQKQLVAPWLKNLRDELNRNPKNKGLAGSVTAELDNFWRNLSVKEEGNFEPSGQPIPYGQDLTPSPLGALIPVKAVAQQSNVKVIHSSGLTPSKPLYIIDPDQLPRILNRNIHEINVIGSSSLLNFDPYLHTNENALFLSSGNLFTDELYYLRTKGALPGTWLDRKLNIDNLTILLPLDARLKEYFHSEDLEKQVEISSVNTNEGQGIRITLTLKLTGDGNQPVNYSVFKDFPLRAENEIKKQFPIIALWPNVPPAKWKEYFVFVESSNNSGEFAFGIEEPTNNAIQSLCKSGQEYYQYWKCSVFPDILCAIDDNAKFLGLLPLIIPKVQHSGATTWTVGVDFGTSFTNVYVRKGNGQPEKLTLEPNLLKITRTLEGEEIRIYREFFVADGFLPRGDNPPLSTILTSRGWQQTSEKIPEPITNARIYFPPGVAGELSAEHIKTNIKWQQVEYQRPFLAQLARLIAAQAALEDVHTIEWAISYPSAFSKLEQNRYIGSWDYILPLLVDISGQNQQNPAIKSETVRTESIAFAQFFADILDKNLVHTTCVDIGGGTSDISIWQENQLIHQASVPYAGRNMFHQILKPNLAYVGDIFGLSADTVNALRRNLSNIANFDSALDIYLRSNAKEILSGGYAINYDKKRNKEFRTLLAFSFGGLYHYLGLIQKYLRQDGLLNQDYVTSVFIGGNGSRFLDWLTTNGSYSQNSEINQLLEGILTKASLLKANPDNLTLSPSPKQEACGGLVVRGDGEKLKNLEQKEIGYPFLAEQCVINGQKFEPQERLELLENWEKIEEFSISSFNELTSYIDNFNAIITAEKIQEIDPLRNFDKGGQFKMTEDLKTLLQTKVTQACLRKKVSVAEFEPEPPFLIALRCLVGVLAEQWAKIK
jgi:hypothetical protein